MTTDHLPFLAAIKASPADDLPRLVFADYLEERGEGERAEFIRVQCELAKVDTEKRGWLFLADGSGVDAEMRAVRDENPHAERLRRREGQLYHRYNAERWFGDLYAAGFLSVTIPQWDATNHLYGSRAVVARGFISLVRCDLAAWLAHGPAVAKAHPVESVEITNETPWKADGADDQWGWWDALQYREDGDAGLLPKPLFDVLWAEYPGARHEDEFGRWMIWDTSEDASDALNVSALLWTQQEATHATR